MANDKDFIVKNAVEVGGSTKVTLGTITSSDIDLSTGNYFSDTLAANTTYTISNAGDVQSFQVEVTGGGVGYGIANANYDNKSVVVNQDTNPRDVYFKPDGTKFFIAGNSQDEINDYDCSTAWDISTATFNQSYVTSNTTAPFGLAFNADGTKMFVVDVSAPASVDEYSLSTAWDQTSATYVDSLDTSTQGADTGLVFNGDGTSLYVGTGGGTIYQYNMTTAYDVSAGSYASKSLDVSSEVGSDFGCAFNADGTKLFVLSYTGFAVYQYSLSTAYDISTGSYDNVSFSVASEATTATNGITFGNSGTKMYVISVGDDTLYQYSTSSAATLTWPSSIEWAGGVAPAAPATGETDLFTITTDDGGTTYTGVKTADNLS